MNKKIIYGLGVLFSLMIITISDLSFARVILIDNQSPAEVGNEFILNFNNDYDSYSLKFGENLDSAITFDKLLDTFKVNRDFDFTNHQVKNIRIDNQTTAPNCDNTVSGKIYFNTTDKNSYLCDGTKWSKLNSASKKYAGYRLEKIDQTDGSVSYILRSRLNDSKWLITKSNLAGFTYAQSENNSGITDLNTAWNNHLTLNYTQNFLP